jgi:hypothetical protein
MTADHGGDGMQINQEEIKSKIRATTSDQKKTKVTTIATHEKIEAVLKGMPR